MVKLVASVCLCLLALVGHAETSQERCIAVGELGASVMQARQGGVPLREALRVTDGNSAIQQIVLVAYQVPVYSSDIMKRQAIREFEEEVTMACLRVAEKRRSTT